MHCNLYNLMSASDSADIRFIYKSALEYCNDFLLNRNYIYRKQLRVTTYAIHLLDVSSAMEKTAHLQASRVSEKERRLKTEERRSRFAANCKEFSMNVLRTRKTSAHRLKKC